jgi:hypothetical protein
VLRNNSVLVLHDAVVRNDSLVEVAGPETRGVDLAEVIQVESWQPGGERITGGVALGIVVGVVALLTALGLAVAD